MPLLLFAGLLGLGAGAGAYRAADETGDAIKLAVPLLALGAGYLVAKKQGWI